MTAHQLAKQLLAGPDLPVRLVYPFGDRRNTEVAAEVYDVERGTVRHSTYHNMDRRVTADDKPDDGSDVPVVMLTTE